jgi:hypothetical protein
VERLHASTSDAGEMPIPLAFAQAFPTKTQRGCREVVINLIQATKPALRRFESKLRFPLSRLNAVVAQTLCGRASTVAMLLRGISQQTDTTAGPTPKSRPRHRSEA